MSGSLSNWLPGIREESTFLKPSVQDGARPRNRYRCWSKIQLSLEPKQVSWDPLPRTGASFWRTWKPPSYLGATPTKTFPSLKESTPLNIRKAFHFCITLQYSREFFLLMNVFIYLFLAALGLRCCTGVFSSCGEQGLLFAAVCGL